MRVYVSVCIGVYVCVCSCDYVAGLRNLCKDVGRVKERKRRKGRMTDRNQACIQYSCNSGIICLSVFACVCLCAKLHPTQRL